MSIEIDILNGDASWQQVGTAARGGMAASYHRDGCPGATSNGLTPICACCSMRRSPDGGLACHVGIYFRTVTWNGAKCMSAASAGLRPGRLPRPRLCELALNAAVQTMRAHEATRFALLFCEPHNFVFYQARGWHPFAGEICAEQPEGGSASRRWRPSCSISSARRARAPSTYAACRGDPAAPGLAQRARPPIICWP